MDCTVLAFLLRTNTIQADMSQHGQTFVVSGHTLRLTFDCRCQRVHVDIVTVVRMDMSQF